MSDQCDWVAPEIVHASDTARASTCASGKNVTMRWPGKDTEPISFSSSAQHWYAQLPCEISTPFGRPVVPEVYTMEPRVWWRMAATRSSISDCSTSRPSNFSVSTPEALNS